MGIDKHIQDLIDKLKHGSIPALARAITLLEEGGIDMLSIEPLLDKNNKAVKIGVTGPPGAGKSSLIDWLIKHIRQTGADVGVLATDPSSPFTGGAILGDRIRMQHHFLDDHVFIRSLGSRGSQGGISRITRDASHLMESAGYKYIILETVGVGQTELDIMNIADTVIVVLVPESGDFVQAMKAGLMEIADIFVVNKSDREGSKQMVNAIKLLLETSEPLPDSWQPPVLLTNGLDGTGTLELFQTIQKHIDFINTHKNDVTIFKKRLNNLKQLILEQIGARLDTVMDEKNLNDYKKELLDPSISLYTILNKVMRDKKIINSLFG
ncbi:MAG: methylmalonyl Co-A mutase-associated GTPase MeaB [bacterium]